MSLSRRKWNTFSSASSEQRKFIWTCEVLHSAYILHFDWLDAHKNALEFQLVEILNFEPVKLVCMYCILCAPHFKRAVPGARYCTIHWTLSLRRCSHEQCWPTAHLLLVMLSIMDTRMGLALSLLLPVIMMTLLSEANRILSLVLQSLSPSTTRIQAYLYSSYYYNTKSTISCSLP